MHQVDIHRANHLDNHHLNLQFIFEEDSYLIMHTQLKSLQVNLQGPRLITLLIIHL